MKCTEPEGTEKLQGVPQFEVERDKKVGVEPELRLNLYLSPLCFLDGSS